jgi:phage-related minor tail protein
MLSNREFVFTAEATKRIGPDRLYAMMRNQRGARGYAKGGLVGGSSNAGAGGAAGDVGMIMTAWSPEDRALMRAVASGLANLQVEYVDVAKAAQIGDRQVAGRGVR